jgi:hypothetical protein
MRVFSGLVLAGWLAGSVAPPCLVGSLCAGTVRHECCCGGTANCCCHLTAAGPAASSLSAAAPPPAPDGQGLPAPEASALASATVTPSPRVALVHALGRFESPPLYISSHTIRC